MTAPEAPQAQTESVVLTHRENGVATITVNRPDKLNALNADVIAGLERAFEDVGQDPGIRAVILTGAGDRAFVAGADIGELQALDPRESRTFVERGHALMRRIERLGKPVIAAVNGFALGGGCELALACTLRLASDAAMLGLPEVKLGLIPGYGGTQRLARQVGRGRALHMMLTGDPVNAEQAQAMGLVNSVHAADELSAVATKLAGKLAAGAPLAMAAIMRSVNRGADLPFDEGIGVETDQFVAICDTEDMQEGTSAFLEKRKAEFSGR